MCIHFRNIWAIRLSSSIFVTPQRPLYIHYEILIYFSQFEIPMDITRLVSVQKPPERPLCQ